MIPGPILAVKLFIPPLRPDSVPRSRLLSRLNDGFARGLILLSASAGFGKTTLISEWAADCTCQVAWLALDEGDSEVHRFLAYLIAAFQKVEPEIGRDALDLLHGPQAPPAESLLILLLNDLSRRTEDLLLVLDDYHTVISTPVDELLLFLVENRPPRLHLVVATREDPPLPLARLRVRNQVSELRAADLRFTPDEAAQFLNHTMDLKLNPEEINKLEYRTEGWIAGLQLAAISLTDHNTTSEFIDSFSGSNRFILDYLLDEVLKTQSETVKNFLLCTSILTRICSSLCDALLPESAVSGEEMILRLERANLFIVPLDDERRWFRYHHLFGDLLRGHLTTAPDDSATEKGMHPIEELHRRAGRWFEENGLEEEAIDHTLAARDFEQAARLIEAAWPAMEADFRGETWLGWARQLPEELVRQKPGLSLCFAWALLDSGEPTAAESRLNDAENGLGEAGAQSSREEAHRSVLASIATARTYLTQAAGDIAISREFAQKALALLPQTNHLGRGQVESLLGIAYWSDGRLQQAVRSLRRGMDHLKETGNLLFALSGTIGLVEIFITCGELNRARTLCTESLQLATSKGGNLRLIEPSLHLGLASIYLEQGKLDEAARELKSGRDQGEKGALSDWPARQALTEAVLTETQEDYAAALAHLDIAEQSHFNGPLPDVLLPSTLRARIWIRQERLPEAREWAEDHGLTPGGTPDYLREQQYMVLARILLAELRKNQRAATFVAVQQLLGRLHGAAEEGGRTSSVIEILILQTLTLDAHGERISALQALRRALGLAAPEGFARPFLVEGNLMKRLLETALYEKIQPDFVSGLLSRFCPSSVNQPLSRRELEILTLIAQGFSNQEIAERLFISLSTVKGHNLKIFAKLEVQRRTEAVVRARELQLL